MKKLYAIVFMAMLAFTGKAFAEISYGVSAALTKIDASGTETEGGEKTDGSADNTVIIPSLFVEYAYSDTISVGLDYIPLGADVSSKTKKRQDTETSVTGTAASTTTARTQQAQAELDNQTYDKNLWTKAFVQYPENENLQKSEYIKLRVANLEKEYKQEQEALEKAEAEAEGIKAMTWKERWKKTPFDTKVAIIIITITLLLIIFEVDFVW